ncbi:Hypothetical protein FKW44_017466 [Caligus rogercresseyi]|uniref:Uncharacterized protein n=1 Tax=Caligus rogercresseyi TaxID=217165 RepID=A0A7T8JWZ6_CALRO|nr:Hypothetical protein FKW44_017466 [Caligus rogercresseyi]
MTGFQHEDRKGHILFNIPSRGEQNHDETKAIGAGVQNCKAHVPPNPDSREISRCKIP